MLRAKAKWELGRSRVTILDLGVLKVSNPAILLLQMTNAFYETLQKKGQWALHAYIIANFFAT